MRIVVKGLDYFDNTLEIEFSGKTSYGESICLQANYNEDLTMNRFEGADSSRDNVKYYIEIAEYFKAMLELENSSELRECFSRVEDTQKRYDDKKEGLYAELRKVRNDISELTDEMMEVVNPVMDAKIEIGKIKQNINKCSKQSSIDARKSRIQELRTFIDEQEKANNTKVDVLEKQLSELKSKAEQIDKEIVILHSEYYKDIQKIEINLCIKEMV